MTVFTCQMWDGYQMEIILIGVFPTLAKAMEAGGLYLAEHAHNAHLLDWDHDANVYTDWYQDDRGHSFTRTIHECEVGKQLA